MTYVITLGAIAALLIGFARIVPSVALAVLVLDYLPHRGWGNWSTLDYLRNILAPPGYAFVEQILVLYVPFFLVQRLGGRRGNARALGVSMVLMLLVPAIGDRSITFHPFHWLYYFAMMLFGTWVAWRDEPARVVTPGDLGSLALIAPTHGVAKLAVSRPTYAEWFPMVHFLVFPLIFVLVRVSQAEEIARFVGRHRWIEWAIGLVGGLTLEIYLVHYAVRDSPIVARLAFPFNIALILLGSVAFAFPLGRGADWLRRSPRLIAELAGRRGRWS